MYRTPKIEVIENILPFVLNTKQPLSDIWLLVINLRPNRPNAEIGILLFSTYICLYTTHCIVVYICMQHNVQLNTHCIKHTVHLCTHVCNTLYSWIHIVYNTLYSCVHMFTTHCIAGCTQDSVKLYIRHCLQSTRHKVSPQMCELNTHHQPNFLGDTDL